MRAYIQLFITLFFPLSILFTVASSGYFSFDYDFSKAIKLGILSGIVISMGISLIMAFFLLLLRKIPKNETIQNEEESESATNAERVPTARTETTKAPRNPKQTQNRSIGKEIKCMLLMDRALTFHVLLNAVKDQNAYNITESDPKKGTINIQTKEGMIQTTITSLTQHSSQLMLVTKTMPNRLKNLSLRSKKKSTHFYNTK